MWLKYSYKWLKYLSTGRKKEYDDNLNHIRHKRTYKKILNKLIILIWFKKIKYDNTNS